MGSKDAELRKLASQVSVLEKQVAFLLQLNKLHLANMRNTSDADLLRIYQDAVHLIAVVKRTPMEVVERWAEIFMQISEVEMTRLQPIIGIDHTWEPFYLLCTKMMTRVRLSEEMGISLRTQQLFAMLEKGRQNLRDCGVIMCQRFRDSLSEAGQTLIKGDDLTEYM